MNKVGLRKEKIFGEQENFLWLSWQKKDFLFSVDIYSLPFLYCLSIQFLVTPFLFILLSHPFSSMKFHCGPLSSLWTGLYFLWCSLAGKQFLMPSSAATYGFHHMRFHHSLSSQFRSVGSCISLSGNMCLVSSTLDR